MLGLRPKSVSIRWVTTLESKNLRVLASVHLFLCPKCWCLLLQCIPQ